ncbi:uncharacterized protein LOC135168878 [Diachasmimorpha longicaudata]|uniref:uncharacterized protein LOC135168878 n=1 Tax=Diachasmimorpha longicaudata TaxID=58733 RepID=UPI0030B8C586
MGEQLCQGKDVFERMNYLFQAGQLLSRRDHVAASLCGNVMVNCSKRSVLRMEPEIKRSICKSCQVPLVPGESAKVRLISKPVKAVKWTCLLCKTTRTIPTKRGYKLWTEQAESVVKTFDYTPKPVDIVDRDGKLIERSVGPMKEKNSCDVVTSV